MLTGRSLCACVMLTLALPGLTAFAPLPAAAQDPTPPVVQTTPPPAPTPPTAESVPQLPVPPPDEVAQPGPVAAPQPLADGRPAADFGDLSPWGMYRAAHWVVQAVMVSLAFAAFVTWTVLAYKLVELAAARRQVSRSGQVIQEADTLEAASTALTGQRDPAAFMAHSALNEYNRSLRALDVAGPDGVKERTRSLLDRVEVQAGAHLRRGMGIVATIGATAPFVGLFGTVWGIMNAFVGIAESRTTNLAVVAPGLAEALLATAIGLVAAIPAVVIYNHFARAIAAYRQMLGDAAAGVERLLSRDLDFRRIRKPGV